MILTLKEGEMGKGGWLAGWFMLLLAAGGPAMAEKVIWIDEKGVVHSEVRGGPGAEKERHLVELYVTSWCPYCHKAIHYFRSRGIPFTAYDIEKDASAAQRKTRLDDRKGVPFAVVNGQKIHGFSPSAYERALEVRRK
jgi:glutaredoxin